MAMNYLSRRRFKRNSRKDREELKRVIEEGLAMTVSRSEFQEMGLRCDDGPPETEEHFRKRARKEAGRRWSSKAFEDGDRIAFGHTQCPLVSRDFETQVTYCIMRLNGESHSMAEMLATRSFPGLRTDSEFNKGKCNGNQFEQTPGLGNFYKGIADEAGVSTTGKTYMSSLATYPGDPRAWVSSRAEVKDICDREGFISHGAVEYNPGPRDPKPDVKIAPDIIDNEVADIMDDVAEHGYKQEDVYEKVYQLRTGQLDKGELLLGDSPNE